MLIDLMINCRNYITLPAGFDKDQLYFNLEYTEREFNQKPKTVPCNENFVVKDLINT